ncbi:MAG TPA: sulfate ABC transporter permease subunit CysW [bacterium]|nr:sulfate ABC transporter permease subunit CysW [bacterium]
MASAISRLGKGDGGAASRATSESAPVRWLLILIALLFLAFFLVVPLVEVFSKAFSEGWAKYGSSISDDSETLAAIKLTLITAGVAVPLNILFGLASAWAIAKFEFRGKNFLITLIDLPFSVSPVISGMVFVLLFGAQGFFWPVYQWFFGHLLSFFVQHSWSYGWILHLIDNQPKIIFHPIGIILATIFVTFPFVARELIPLMQAQGREEEEAAMTLGAGGLRTFLKVTLPNIKWGLLYGVILCNARAMGEFGAVSVVSGHIRGLTNTMPLQVQILYDEHQTVAAFAVASLLALLALLTLVGKGLVEWRAHRAA